MKVGRNPGDDNSIHIRFFQKYYCAKRILDFHSFHPRRMKDNVVKEFLRSALSLSSNRHWKNKLRALKKTLRNSNYPNRYINEKVNSVMKGLKMETGPNLDAGKKRKGGSYLSHINHVR